MVWFMANLIIRETEGGIVFTVKVVPGSSRTVICGLFDGMLKIKVSAVAEKGKANKCLVDFLAGQIGVKKKAVSIISGLTRPVKQIRVLDISAQELIKKLNLG